MLARFSGLIIDKFCFSRYYLLPIYNKSLIAVLFFTRNDRKQWDYQFGENEWIAKMNIYNTDHNFCMRLLVQITEIQLLRMKVFRLRTVRASIKRRYISGKCSSITAI